MSPKPPIQKFKNNQYLSPEISDDQISRIGRVIVLWSKLEAAMEDTIWMFLYLDEEDGRIITSRLATDAKMQRLRGLAQRHISEENLAKEFMKRMALADELKDCRNFIVHGTWGTLMPENVPVALSLKLKSDESEVIAEMFPRERMESIASGIQRLLHWFVDLPEQLGKPRRVP